MNPGYVLALDLGTTSVRALLVAESGSVCARAQRPLSATFPRRGWVEQDPNEMWRLAVDVLRDVMSQISVDPREVAALGVVTQRATAHCWDATTGEPLAPAIGWQDARTAERVRGLRDLGLPINTLATATKFEWLLENATRVVEAARAGRLRLGTPDAWITFMLTSSDAHVTDPGNASCTALLDSTAGEWAPPLLELFHVPPEVLPEVVASSRVVGTTPGDLLGAPVPVAARAGDQQAAAFAQGVHASGQAKLTLGTSAMLDLHVGSAPVAPGPGSYPLVLWRLDDSELAHCLEASVITAGAAVDWLAGFGFGADAREVDRLARQVESTGGVLFLPALQGLGSPFLDESATAMFAGLTRGSGRPELARAVLEGVAHRCVDLCETLGVAGILPVDGGLARSDFVLQAIADLGGIELLRAAEPETTALGAAFLAGLATDFFTSPADCQTRLSAPTRFAPRTDEHHRKAERDRWRDLLSRNTKTSVNPKTSANPA